MNIDETKNRIASRFQVCWDGELVSSHSDHYEAYKAALAFMHKSRVSPVEIFDSMKGGEVQFATSAIHIAAYADESRRRDITERAEKLLAHCDALVAAEGEEFSNGAFDSMKDTMEEMRESIADFRKFIPVTTNT